MTQYDHKTAVAIFIRTKGLTRCPTACAAPPQGLPNASDQAALEQYATARNRSQEHRGGRARPTPLLFRRRDRLSIII